MLTLYNGNTPIVLKQDDYYIRQLSNGLDELIFEISVKDDDYRLIVEEAQIQDRGEQVYLVKQIDGGNDRAKVVCQIDVDPWRGAFFQNYSNESATIMQTLLQVRPEGWTVEDKSGISTRRTIPTSDTAQPYSVTAWQVVEAVCNMWDVRIRVDTAAKKLTVLNPKTYGSVGAFASRELNLRKLSYKGKSQGFVTRLYAEGADGLTFADINDGKNYVEDKTYKNVVVSAFWKDERYTDKNSLLEDARAKLAVMAKPQISYDCDIIDLAAIDPSRQWAQDMSMFARITLLDDTRGTAIEHQVVERWEYPYYPNKDKVVLSTQVPKIQTQVQSVINAIDNPTSVYNQIISATVQNQTNLITGNNGGYVVLHDSNGDGHPDELLIMDTPDINTAQELWRWNAAGLGYSRTGYNGTFITAWTMDGSFNADFITAGTINAELVRVINLIADRVESYSASRDMSTIIRGGRFEYDYISGDETKNRATFSIVRYQDTSGDIRTQGRLTLFGDGVDGSELSAYIMPDGAQLDGPVISRGFTIHAKTQSGVAEAFRLYPRALNTVDGFIKVNGNTYLLRETVVKDANGNNKTIVAFV